MESARPIIKIFDSVKPARAIYGSLRTSDLTKLLRVSRTFFRLVAPVVWGTIPIEKIANLIPGVEKADSESGIYENVLVIPKHPDMSRVYVYAPYIKRLNATPQYRIKFGNMYEPSSAPGLLPNLAHISLASLPNYDSGDFGGIWDPIDVDWLAYFACPSLLSFEMYGFDAGRDDYADPLSGLPWIEQSEALKLFDWISGRCPHIEKLRIFPYESPTVGPINMSLGYMQLATLVYLRSFTYAGLEVDQELMDALSLLPRLESLQFISNMPETPNYHSGCDEYYKPGTWPEYDFPDPIVLPKDAFPALRSLELLKLGPKVIARICRLKPLFRNLTRFKVTYEDYSSPYWKGRDWRNEVLASLGNLSSCLTDLEIDNVLALDMTVEKLAQMPLQRLGLRGIGVRGLDHAGWKKFVDAIPNLEILNIRFGPTYECLNVLAQGIPSLRVLSQAALYFTEMKGLKEDADLKVKQRLPSQEITLQTTFRLRFPMERQVDEVAR
ncbi:LRR receptor-like serine/threonine-protein kinase [Ceratobasidium sp. AG-Ba]|nr:LRR receptor-like serine/threonine-protein kinase [Ceratobasidium sp. AG-Ba]QRW07601.1 LRR receptor-like serine/threonine-protein kinase [Ceratobasidium sp. AG-Ba]